MGKRWWALTALLPLWACEAQLGHGDRPGEDGYRGSIDGVPAKLQNACMDLGDGIRPGPSPTRRLTRAEYNATVRELLDDESAPADAFPPEPRALGFHGIAEAQTVTVLLAEGYMSAAKSLAREATADVEGLLGCDPSQSTCVEDFVEQFGGLAYRRPLKDSEIDALVEVFAWGRDNLTVTDGIQMVLEVLLQSPDFLYRPEFGADEVEPGILRLSSWEMATRLSYLFTGTMPDDELRRAATADELKTPEQLLAQAKRLLETDAARDTFRNFHAQWLDLEGVDHIERDAGVYDGFTDEIPHLMRQETEAFIEHVLFEDDGSLRTLLTAPYTLVNAQLAEFYGLPAPQGEGFQVVDTSAAKRAGLLTQGSLLAHHAQPLQTSPVHRGKFIRESILCQMLKPPPADLVIEPPDLDPDLTTRERFNAHSEDPSCSGCHRLMDPLGLGFEHFDPVGRYRESENGKPIDASGELVEADVEGNFYGALELSDMLSQSDEVSACVVTQWMRFSLGRSETPDDACTMTEVAETFVHENYRMVDLLLALTQTDAFQYRKVVQP